jgi:hypothetical protein
VSSPGPFSFGYALLYPVLVPAVCFVFGLFLMPETHGETVFRHACELGLEGNCLEAQGLRLFVPAGRSIGSR